MPYAGERLPETLLYLSDPGDLAAYEELRAGFTAAVSHELRTPLARLLALLESAALPGAEPLVLIDQARAGGRPDPRADRRRALPERARERAARSSRSASIRALPVLEDVVESLASRAERAGVRLRLESAARRFMLPLRQRMLQVVAENLAENAIRYAGDRRDLHAHLP